MTRLFATDYTLHKYRAHLGRVLGLFKPLEPSPEQPWHGAMEATIFSAWIYDTLTPYAERLEIGHPAMMKAITAGKKKSDIIDARTIADLVRCDLLPGCYVFPPELRDLRRLMR